MWTSVCRLVLMSGSEVIACFTYSAFIIYSIGRWWVCCFLINIEFSEDRFGYNFAVWTFFFECSKYLCMESPTIWHQLTQILRFIRMNIPHCITLIPFIYCENVQNRWTKDFEKFLFMNITCVGRAMAIIFLHSVCRKRALKIHSSSNHKSEKAKIYLSHTSTFLRGFNAVSQVAQHQLNHVK